VETTSSAFSEFDAIKLEINNGKKMGKCTDKWKLNSIFLNNQWIKEEIQRENNKCLEKHKNENTDTKTYEKQQKQFQKGSLS
jgi:hypothetical protein